MSTASRAAETPPAHRLPLADLLPGMVARGHGLDALELFLDIARATLLAWIVLLSLSMPHDRPCRRSTHPKAWRPEEIPDFIQYWLAGWRVASLATRYGRSPGAIYAKARHLGLPKRDRRTLLDASDPLVGRRLRDVEVVAGPSSLPVPTHHPLVARVPPCAVPESSVSVAAHTPSPLPPSASVSDIHDGSMASLPGPTPAAVDGRHTSAPVIAAVEGNPTPRQMPLPGVPDGPITASRAKHARTGGLSAGKVLPNVAVGAGAFLPMDLPVAPDNNVALSPTRRIRGPETKWCAERDLELAYRHWSRQDNAVAAREMGISLSALWSRKVRLELPPMPRGAQNHDFSAERAMEQIRVEGYKRVRCRAYHEQGVEFWFWCRQRDHRYFSKQARKKTWYSEASFH